MADAQAARKPTKPQKLGKAGSDLWRKISDPAKYTLRPDELAILGRACKMADRIEKLEGELEFADMMVRGSQGQDVINPMIPELRQHETALAALLLKLKLPDDEAEKPAENPRSVGARNAANSRWGNTG